MEQKIIGIAGFRNSGKSEAARALMHAGFKQVSFADAIREEVFEQYPAARDVPEHRRDEPMEVLGGKSVRSLIMAHGMNRWAQDQNYWFDAARSQIESAVAQGASVVVDAVRTSRQAATIREMGALLVWVARAESGTTSVDRGDDLSEMCDIVVNNAGSQEDLARKMMGIISNRCGSCVQLLRDKTLRQYGFCSVAPEKEKARLAQTSTPCFTDGYKPMPGFVPPSQASAA